MTENLLAQVDSTIYVNLRTRHLLISLWNQFAVLVYSPLGPLLGWNTWTGWTLFNIFANLPMVIVEILHVSKKRQVIWLIRGRIAILGNLLMVAYNWYKENDLLKDIQFLFTPNTNLTTFFFNIARTVVIISSIPRLIGFIMILYVIVKNYKDLDELDKDDLNILSLSFLLSE